MTVRFKDLCADAADPARVAAFWADLLGLVAEPRDGGLQVLLRDGTPWLWVNPVPEPKTVKNRVHLDIVVPGRDVPGATRLAEYDVFSVYADPEGNEFCAFDPEPGDPSVAPRAFALCTDSAEPVAAAAWWAARTGARIVPGPDGTPRYLEDVPGLDMTWKFVPVDDPRGVKNRWHWDVDAAEVEGATTLRPPGAGRPWTVMADPQGNEFCRFP
ncbi:MAG: glyoxalase [Pseudonocardiaceae bacterium]|nr:MAG: glyoxalase [Pseudonocardiaceae bacterium]